MKTMYDLVKNEIDGKEIWDYQVYAPVSLEDGATIEVLIHYGKDKIESTKKITLDIKGKQ